MQISTNWSVSHLRHWHPPVASSGYYLYRYTGRSWFKSKQSALRSILPNANIHHNEKRPGRGQKTDSWCPHWCLLLISGGQAKRPSFPCRALRNSAHQAGQRQCHTGVYDVRVWMMSECFPVKNRSQGRRSRRVGRLFFGSPWAKPQLRDIINSKLAAEQHDLCSLRNYHSTLFTKTGRIESFLIF